MIFTEPRYLLFFLAVFSVYWLLPTNAARKAFLLMASYVFYGSWNYRFLSLLWATTCIDYMLGRLLASERQAPYKKQWVAVSVVANLTFLGFFKYYNFFVDSALASLHALGVPASAHTLAVVLPAGISFYTFMSMSYTIDVYYGHPPAKRFLDFALFVSFFPHLVAGPILRASQFLPQFDDKKQWVNVNARRALVTFLVGYVKKACVADNVAPIVERYFAHPSAYDARAAWIAVLFYAVQIYCDFSGYSDMAIASARLLGYELCLNFDFPYFASSVTAFWRRWHISLSNWLRDYVYIPLGGNRGSRVATYRNLMITMLLGGLWHGAAWHFVAWGGLHGVALSVERAIGIGQEARRVPNDQASVGSGERRTQGFATVLGALVTFLWVCIAWIFFRARDFSAALVTLRSFVTLHSPGAETFPAFLFAVFAGLVVVHWISCKRRLSGLWERLPLWGFAPAYGVAVALAVAWVPVEHRPFIYFQF